METFDPVSDAADTPRVPLDSLLDPSTGPDAAPGAGGEAPPLPGAGHDVNERSR
jgi:hypothetical protein